jgi:hypothetical protein
MPKQSFGHHEENFLWGDLYRVRAAENHSLKMRSTRQSLLKINQTGTGIWLCQTISHYFLGNNETSRY